MDNKFVKIVVFVPLDKADKVRQVLNENGAGKIGNYDYCSFSLVGIGRFRPLMGAHPTIGREGEIAEVKEERIETVCSREDMEKIIQAVKRVHPYEEPVIDIYPLISKPEEENEV